MGVNGQILMHYSALIGQKWDEYIAAMKQGVREARSRARGPLQHVEGSSCR